MTAAISSAPGDPYVSVHIQAVGDWTKKLHEIMKDYCARIEVREHNPPLPRGGLHSHMLRPMCLGLKMVP